MPEKTEYRLHKFVVTPILLQFEGDTPVAEVNAQPAHVFTVEQLVDWANNFHFALAEANGEVEVEA